MNYNWKALLSLSTAIFAAHTTLDAQESASDKYYELDAFEVSPEERRISTVGAKTDTPLIELPRSVSVISAEDMALQNVATITEAIRYSPGVFGERYGVDTRQTDFVVRGFTNTDNLYIDGMFLGGDNTDVYGKERIDLVRGPSSTLYGAGSPGGLVNIVTKRPKERAFGEAIAMIGSFDQKEARIDLGGPLSTDDNTVLYRLTALYRDSGSQIDRVEDNREYIAPGVTWNVSENTRFTLLGHYQKDHGNNLGLTYPLTGTVLPNPNGQISTNFFGGEPDFDEYESKETSIAYFLEHTFNENWSLRHNLRNTQTDSVTNLVRVTGLLADQNIPAPILALAFPGIDPTRTLVRTAGGRDYETDVFTIDTNLEGNFETGETKHRILIGFDYQERDRFYVRRESEAPNPTDPASIAASRMVIDMFDPEYGAPVPTQFIRSNTTTSRERFGIYAQDQIKFDEKWVATLGIRYDDTSDDTFNHLSNATTSEREDNSLVYNIGVTRLLDSGFAPYYSYSESFVPQSGNDFFGESFEPQTGAQHEVGIKYQPKNYNALFAVSAYDLRKQNVKTPDPDPDHAGFRILTGEVLSQGVEFETQAYLTENFSMTAALTLMHIEVSKSNNPGEIGQTPIRIPEQAASLWGNYIFRNGPLAGLSLGGGIRHQGPTQAVWTSNTTAISGLRVPGFTVVDTVAAYQWDRYRIQFNVSNVGDKTYIAGASPSNASYGLRRKATLSFITRW